MGLISSIGRCTLALFVTTCSLAGYTSADTLIVPLDYPTIQSAIKAANDGDTVQVDPGTYLETINFLGKEITVESSDGASVTTIDANQLDTVVYFWLNETNDSILDGFSITGGTGFDHPAYGTHGGGMFVAYSSPTIRNCIFDGNSADWDGGAVYVDTSSPTFESCIFSNNQSNFSSGGAIYAANSNATITDCIVTNNTAKYGGGIYTYDTPTSVTGVSITDCTISENEATGDGGGLIVFQNGGATISGCTISGNTANSNGGGCKTSGNAAFMDCVFDGNSSQGTAGGIRVSHDGGYSPSFTDCVISNNTSESFGGGIEVWNDCQSVFTRCKISGNTGDQGGGAFISDCEPTFNGCKFIGNATIVTTGIPYGLGGALSIGGGPSSPTISNCVISGNIAARGAGIHIYTGDPDIVNTSIFANTSGHVGGGVLVTSNANPSLQNSIVWGNEDIFGSGETSQIHLENQGDTASIIVSDSIVEHWSGDLGGSNNSGTDPRWVSPLGEDGISGTLDDDLHLHPTSPCIDAGDNASAYGTTDFDGDPRFLDDPHTDDSGSGQGPIVDIGPDEYVVALTGDTGPRLWMDSGTPSCMFDDTDNWLPGEVPDLDNLAMFEVDGEANVCLSQDTTVEQLIIANGDIYLDLGGMTLTSLNEVLVAPFGGKIANLTVTGDSFGVRGGVQGILVFESLDVGGNGIGTFNLDENVSLIADEILMRYGASIDGEPTIESDMNNFGGRIRPGINGSGSFDVNVPGSIVIDGDYTQAGSPDIGSLPRYGSMEFDIDPSDTSNPHDYLEVTGHATLSGILELNFDTSYVNVGNRFDVLSASTVSGDFDLLYVRGLQNGESVLLENQVGVVGKNDDFRIVETTDIVFGGTGGVLMSNGGDPTDMIAVDLDQQGGIDVVISRLGSSPSQSGVVEIYFDIYSGTMNPMVINVGIQPQGLDAADIDGDGDLDIAVVNAGSDTVSILTNSNSTFSVLNIDVSTGPVDLAFGDFITADPRIDLAVAATESDAIDVLQNTSTLKGSNFIVINTINIGKPKDIDPGDVNNDKDLDYISSSRSDSTTTAQTGDGKGGASSGALIGGSAHTRVPVGGSPQALKVTDMNGDGLDDTITINGDGSISLRLGLLNVAATVALSDPQALAIGDFDNDGDKDIVVSADDPSGGSAFPLVLVIRNDTTEGVVTLTESITYAGGVVGSLLDVGDVDGDGLLDIVGVTGSTDNLYIEYWINETVPLDTCRADLDDSGIVGVEDLLMVIAAWGQCDGCPEDLDGNGFVRVTDLLYLIANWGSCP